MKIKLPHIIITLLGLIGITACKEPEDQPKCLYGPPYSLYAPEDTVDVTPVDNNQQE
ncbi:MAG: hypothetical protein HUJ92_08180 [Bacteroidales bacterium]|nr:hypothetical protein [Bacteroidales bacterium]